MPTDTSTAIPASTRRPSTRLALSALRRSLGRLRSRAELRWALATNRTDALLRRRMNRWARKGWGESLESRHHRIAEIIWERMSLGSADRILDLGCGQGWASRLIARRAPQGCTVVGVDISDEMIRQAREKSGSHPNIRYFCCGAETIPSPDNYFSTVISIEAFYYFERQKRVLQELFRATKPGGELFLLICLFQEDPNSQAWLNDIALPLHNRRISEYENMLRQCGWRDIHSQVFDFSSPSAPSTEHDRPLLLRATKPSFAVS